MRIRSAILFSAFFVCFLFSRPGFSQDATPTPSPTPDEPVKIATEEVKLNVMARNAYGKFVPTLKPDDLLIVEEGTPQTITSMRRVPANVLFLLDTGGDLNVGKSVALTRLASKIVIDSLSAEDSVAVIQYSDKIEIVSDWTKDRDAVFEGLDRRLISGKRSRFSDGLNAAVDIFNSQPLENRHLVLISDGLESVADDSARQKALQNILAANITIHVISYTQLEAIQINKTSRRVTLGKGDTKPRVPDYIFENLIRSAGSNSSKRTAEIRNFLKAGNESQRLVIISLDNKKITFLRNKAGALRESETTLKSLAEDTGGVFQAPEESITTLEFAIEVASAIGSSYVVTYSPTRPATEAHPIATRKVRVGTHCAGVEIRSRQKLIIDRTSPP